MDVKDTIETIEEAIFLIKFLINYWLVIKSKYLTTSLMPPKTTLGLIWESLGSVLSTIIYAYYRDIGS